MRLTHDRRCLRATGRTALSQQHGVNVTPGNAPSCELAGARAPFPREFAGLVVIPDPVPLSGTYSVVSRFEVPAAAAAPGPLGDALGLIHGMAENPARALLDTAEEAGVPALGTLRLLLPGTLEAKVEEWMNAYLLAAETDGVSPHDQIVELDELIRSVLLAWDLRSELDLPAGAPGTHTPTALVFGTGEPIVVPVDATAAVTRASGVTGLVTWPDGIDGAPRATIGDHFMGVPFGHYALVAVEATLAARYGAADVRGALGTFVDCPGMAESVASRCIGFVCVGNEATLEAVCQGGLDALAEKIEEKVLSLNYEAIRFESGTAAAQGVVVDALSGTATAEQLTGGVWTASVDLGNEPEPADATFTAAR
jgi:hypothetical protein